MTLDVCKITLQRKYCWSHDGGRQSNNTLTPSRRGSSHRCPEALVQTFEQYKGFNLLSKLQWPMFHILWYFESQKKYKEILKAYKSLEICIPRTFDILRWMLQFTCDQELRWWGRRKGCFGYFLPSLTFAVCTWWVGGSGCWGLHILERD